MADLRGELSPARGGFFFSRDYALDNQAGRDSAVLSVPRAVSMKLGFRPLEAGDAAAWHSCHD